MGRLAGVLLFIVAMACACAPADPVRESGTGGGVAAEQPLPLPAAAGLDATRGAAIAASGELDVTSPFIGQHVSVSERSLLLFAPPDEMAYAVLRIAPPPGIPQRISASALGPVWVGLADYARGQWNFIKPAAGLASFELDLDSSFSPGGWIYLAVVCPAGGSGRLDAAALTWEDEIEWNIEINSTDSHTRVAWGDVPFKRFGVLRSMIWHDPAPYLVGIVDEPFAEGQFEFYDYVNEDENGLWVPAMNDNATPADLTDDFPYVTPVTRYYYSIVALFGDNQGARSPDYNSRILWGDRSTEFSRRPPSSTTTSRFFATDLDLSGMSAEQIQFIANRFFGAFHITASEAALLRTYNPEFLAITGQSLMSIGQHYDYYGTKMVYGDYVDPDGDWPYVNRHEPWFVHDPASTLLDGRVAVTSHGYLSGDLLLDFGNPSGLSGTTYANYVAPSLISLTGEDCFDCLVLYNAHLEFDYSPYPRLFEGLENPLDRYSHFSQDIWELRVALIQARSVCPKRPLTIADAYYFGDYNLRAYYQTSYHHMGCDGVLVDSYVFRGKNDIMGNYMDPEGWVNQQNNILLAQNEGFAFMTPRGRRYRPSKDRLVYFGSYLLIRTARSYLGFYDGAPGECDAPYWFPEFDWDSGAALTDNRDYLESMCLGEDYRWGYRRDFENGIVLVCPDYSGETPTTTQLEPGPYEYMVVEGGGPVGPDGIPDGTLTWEPLNGGEPIDSFSFDGGGCYIIRPVPF